MDEERFMERRTRKVRNVEWSKRRQYTKKGGYGASILKGEPEEDETYNTEGGMDEEEVYGAWGREKQVRRNGGRRDCILRGEKER